MKTQFDKAVFIIMSCRLIINILFFVVVVVYFYDSYNEPVKTVPGFVFCVVC